MRQMLPFLCPVDPYMYWSRRSPVSPMYHNVVAASCNQAFSSSSCALRGRSTKTYSVLFTDVGVCGNAPGMPMVACMLASGLRRMAKGLLGSALASSGKTAEIGVRRWLSLRAGGEDLACFSRSSVSRRRASSASSCWVWVDTAFFLCCVSKAPIVCSSRLKAELVSQRWQQLVDSTTAAGGIKTRLTFGGHSYLAGLIRPLS